MIIQNASYRDLQPLISRELNLLSQATNKASRFMRKKAIEHLEYLTEVMQENDVTIELNDNYNYGIITELILKALYIEGCTVFEGKAEQKLYGDDEVEYDIRSSISSTSLCSKINPHLPVIFYANNLVKIITVDALQELYTQAINGNKEVKSLVKIEKDLTMRLKPSLVHSDYAIDNEVSLYLQDLITV